MLNYVEYGKENKYDDDIFFQKYSQMSRSQQGLAGAGEWEAVIAIFGNKVGSPTKNYDSGTIEEIERMIKMGRGRFHEKGPRRAARGGYQAHLPRQHER